MSSDAQSDNTLRHSSRLLHHGFPDSIHASNYCKIEMNIGHWYVDEFGNRTREITARDADEEVQVRTQLEPRNRTQSIRTAAARLAELAAF
jgi:hypothetical protein